jgi:hypothetical protein
MNRSRRVSMRITSKLLEVERDPRSGGIRPAELAADAIHGLDPFRMANAEQP